MSTHTPERMPRDLDSVTQAPHTVRVQLPNRPYDIVVRPGLLTDGTAVAHVSALGAARACIVTHGHLRARYAEPLLAGLLERGVRVEIVALAPGERSKTLRTVQRLYGLFLQCDLDRKSLVISVGGGVLGDLVGFAAATYLRGIGFVQVPTTLLAQVDASIGGKTGVDLPQGKNLVGAFHQPAAVLIDPLALRSLPVRELRSGLAEVIKYGIIKDAEFFLSVGTLLPSLLAREPGALTSVITRSCRIKADVVASDETEQGLRAILNFGHTIGHALETVTHYRRYKHGEAVAIGMVAALKIGEKCGVTPSDLTEQVVAVLRAAGLPTQLPSNVSAEDLLAAARHDKKALDGRIRFVLARALGDVIVTDSVTPGEALLALRASATSHGLAA